jgi:hypothetical protein
VGDRKKTKVFCFFSSEKKALSFLKKGGARPARNKRLLSLKAEPSA